MSYLLDEYRNKELMRQGLIAPTPLVLPSKPEAKAEERKKPYACHECAGGNEPKRFETLRGLNWHKTTQH